MRQGKRAAVGEVDKKSKTPFLKTGWRNILITAGLNALAFLVFTGGLGMLFVVGFLPAEALLDCREHWEKGGEGVVGWAWGTGAHPRYYVLLEDGTERLCTRGVFREIGTLGRYHYRRDIYRIKSTGGTVTEFTESFFVRESLFHRFRIEERPATITQDIEELLRIGREAVAKTIAEKEETVSRYQRALRARQAP